jgi:hypothetical protein
MPHQEKAPMSKGSDTNVDSSQRVVSRIIQYAILAVMVAALFGFLYLISPIILDPPVIDKKTLKDRIVTAIKNEADLRAIKHIYATRAEVTGWDRFHATYLSHYTWSDPLSFILEDVRADVFLGRVDKSLLPRIEGVVAEYSELNPFDKLEIGQKELFERLRTNIGDRYPAVQLEITKIADELYARNALTERYLRKSDLSFWISIVGLCLSLIVGVFQIVQARVRRMQTSHDSESSKPAKADSGVDEA